MTAAVLLDIIAWLVVILSMSFVLYCFAAASIEAIKTSTSEGIKIIATFVVGTGLIIWAIFRVTGGI